MFVGLRIHLGCWIIKEEEERGGRMRGVVESHERWLWGGVDCGGWVEEEEWVEWGRGGSGGGEEETGGSWELDDIYFIYS